MEAGLFVVRKTSLTRAFEKSPSLFSHRPSPTQAFRKRPVMRGSSDIFSAMSDALSGPLESTSNKPSLLAVKSVCEPQYAVLREISLLGSIGGNDILAGLLAIAYLPFGLPIHIALKLHVGAAVAHKAVPDTEFVLAPDIAVAKREMFKIAA